MTDERPKKKWEIVEEFLFDHEVEQFDNHFFAKTVGIANRTATAYIQEYLRVQRMPDSPTLYVLKRNGRTKNAVWSVGERTADAKAIGQTFYDDICTRATRAFVPDVNHLKERNPRAKRYVEGRVNAVLDGALIVLAHALDADNGDNGDDGALVT